MVEGKELTFEITSKCEVGCKWCSTNATANGADVTLSSVIFDLRRYRDECSVVRISGGEPLLHPNLRDILFEAKLLDYFVVLLTNGQILLEPIARQLVDRFEVSLVNQKSVDSVTEYLLYSRCVSVNVVNAVGNENMAQEGMKLVARYGIPLHLLALQKQGRGVNCESSELITWTGQQGCSAVNKITLTANGGVTTCSALKGGHLCNLVVREQRL